MKMHILNREVEGDEHGLYHLEAMGSEVESLFEEAKFKHRAVFKDNEGRHYILTRETAGHYLVAHNDHD